MQNQAIKKVWIHELVWLLLNNFSYFFENVDFEIKQTVIVSTEEFRKSSACGLSNLNILTCQLLANKLEYIDSVVKVGVSLKQGPETHDTFAP